MDRSQITRLANSVGIARARTVHGLFRMLDERDRTLEDRGNAFARLSDLVSARLPERIADVFQETDDTCKLGVFRRHGLDKATKHHYHLAYAHLFGSRQKEALRLLEIDMGSITAIWDGMALLALHYGRGAIRGIVDIIGADIDPETMFAEDDRIRSQLVDQ